jgi:hypothetical protein
MGGVLNRPKSDKKGSLFTADIPVSLTGGKTVGRYATGSTIPAIGKTAQEVFLDIASEYLPPAFTAFAMSGQATIVEVGTVISGNKTFTWATTNNGNVQLNTVKVTDVTNTVDIATGLANDGTEAITLPTPISKSLLASHQWRASALNTQAGNFQSSVFTVNWQFKRFVGTNTNPTLDETAIEALANNSLGANNNGTYSLVAGGYKYLCFPFSYGSPTTSTGIKDTATGFPVAMADSSDDTFYSNIENGWSYGLVAVTNALGVTHNYRVYRSKNILGGSINIQVS